MTNFELIDSKTNRKGIYHTRNGIFHTPCFAPDATRGTIKHLTPRDFEDVGLELILSNTYHLMLRPGEDIVQKAGGIKKFIGHNGPMLTDSGGFQAFSLVHRSKLGKITNEGVEFQSHLDGKKHLLTPELSIEIQYKLGADILMVLDECVPNPCDKKYAEKAMHRTFEWAQRSKLQFDKLTKEDENPPHLWGIIQGSTYDDLRIASAEQILSLDFAGYAVGGLAVGEEAEEMYRILELLNPILPQDKPRYLMGIGTPQNIQNAVKLGIDVFDSVLPTRNARHGFLFTSEGVVRIKNEKYKEDFSVLDKNCNCYACSGKFTKAYIRHLLNVDEPLGKHLCTIHNLTFYQDLMRNYWQ